MEVTWLKNHWKLWLFKLKQLIPPPGNFSTPDRYSRKQWRSVQHVANEFYGRWRKEILLTLQNMEKWNNPKINCQVGDIVLLRQEADCKGNVCSVRLLVLLINQITQLCYLERCFVSWKQSLKMCVSRNVWL